MTVLIDALLAALSEIAQAYAQSDAPPVLMGGLGVHLQLGSHASRGSVTTASTRLDAARLAQAIRPTQDIDLCVLDSHVAVLAAHLGELGFRRVGTRTRFARDDLFVDILTPALSLAGIALVAGMSDPIALGAGAPALVASPAALVATKCEAFASRLAARDLVDLARLALADLHLAQLSGALADLLAQHPRLHDSMQRVAIAFAAPAGRGPEVFFEAFIESLLGVDVPAWMAREQEIRDLTVLAVRQMLEDCELVDDGEA